MMQKAFGLNIPQTLEDVCDPSRLALIVYDMQVGIVSQIANGQKITERVVQVLDAARKAKIRIFYTRHMSLPKELMGVAQLRMSMAWQKAMTVDEMKPWFLRDSPGFHLVPEVAPQANEAIFDKIAMSAFEGTPLNMALRDCGVNAFVIVGIAMEIGIEPTVGREPIWATFQSSCKTPAALATGMPPNDPWRHSNSLATLSSLTSKPCALSSHVFLQQSRDRLGNGSHISHTASTSTIICVRGILRTAASASIARSSAFIFWRLGDLRMKW